MSWSLTGNSGTSPGTKPGQNFVGTSDNQPLVVATNGTQRAQIDTSGNIEINGTLGIGTSAPRSPMEVEVSASAALGPILTVTNGAPDAQNSAAAIDINTYPPPATTITLGTAERPGKPVEYNPSSRIAAESAGNYEADLLFLCNRPGAPNNGLMEKVRITPGGVTLYGTLYAMPTPELLDFSNAGVTYAAPNLAVGIGTTSPRSIVEITANAGGTLGPVITLTNTGGAVDAAAAIDFNTFNPPAAGPYNPSSRIEAVDDGSFANDIVFLSNTPSAPNNKLVERMRISPAGIGIGTEGSRPRSIVEAMVNAGGTLGPVITLTNIGGAQAAAAAIDFNTFDPNPQNYNPSSRILAIDDGGFGNDIIFQSNRPGTANNGLVDGLRISPAGVAVNLPWPQLPLAPLHVVAPQLNNSNLPVVLVESNSQTNTSPRIGLVDTSVAGDQTAPAWFIDNSQDNFRIFRQPDITTAGNAYLQIDNGGTVSMAGTLTVAGDIVLTGGDCAEEFNVSPAGLPEPGTVVVLDPENGGVGECLRAYDKKVVGVVSGAGDLRPAIILDAARSEQPRVPVALNGKVYCKVDAQYAPIEAGDLVTTSSTPGHAMKADDAAKAFGAVIGKALADAREGRQLIPILISLQ